MGGHAFISYKRDDDSAYVASLAAYLTDAGIDVWYDRALLVGGQFGRDLQNMIATCSAFIVVMTPGAEESAWVAREIAEAEYQGRRILPLLRQGRRFFSLGHLHHVDVRGGQMPGAAFITSIRQLCGMTEIASHDRIDGTRISDTSPADIGTESRSEAALRKIAATTGREIGLQGDPPSVLVVDDDVDISRFIEMNLRINGYDVRVARDGMQALEQVAASTPSLAIVDLMMPGVDGLTLIDRLRSDDATPKIPILVLTAKSLTTDKVTGLAAGADDYLTKPFDTTELMARVSAHIRRYHGFEEFRRATSHSVGRPHDRHAARSHPDAP